VRSALQPLALALANRDEFCPYRSNVAEHRLPDSRLRLMTIARFVYMGPSRVVVD
jgi:hypothetical protein